MTGPAYSARARQSGAAQSIGGGSSGERSGRVRSRIDGGTSGGAGDAPAVRGGLEFPAGCQRAREQARWTPASGPSGAAFRQHEQPRQERQQQVVREPVVGHLVAGRATLEQVRVVGRWERDGRRGRCAPRPLVARRHRRPVGRGRARQLGLLPDHVRQTQGRLGLQGPSRRTSRRSSPRSSPGEPSFNSIVH